MIIFLQATVEGLSLAAIYSLVAIGFVLIYKAMEVLSFAQPTTDEERLHAADLVDGVLNAGVECDHVAGVNGDGLTRLNWDLLDGSKGVVPHTALAFCAGCLNEEHGFTAEEALCTLEFGVSLDVEG